MSIKQQAIATSVSIVILLFLVGVTLAHAAQTAAQPQNGGTGTNAVPNYGQVLVGNGSGVYAPQATSTLGISATNYWTQSGSDIYNNNAGNLGIGTTTPWGALSVLSSHNPLLALESASGPGTGIYAVATSSANVLSSASFSSSDDSFAEYTMRDVISAAALRSTGVTPIQITFKASADTELTITSAYVGEGTGSGSPVFASTPTAITFNGGSASAVVAAGATITSDSIAFTPQAGEDLVVSAYTATEGSWSVGATPNQEGYYNNGTDEASSTTASDWNDYGSAVGVSEVASPPIMEPFLGIGQQPTQALSVLGSGNLTGDLQVNGNSYVQGVATVGTTTSQTAFDVNNDFHVSHGGAQGTYVVVGPYSPTLGGDSYGQFNIISSDNTRQAIFRFGYPNGDGATGEFGAGGVNAGVFPNQIFFNTKTTSDMLFAIENDPKMILNGVSGFLGIGSGMPNPPYAPLEVWGPDTDSTAAFIVANSASTTVLTALDNGDVGVGTTTPQHQFSVQTDIQDYGGAAHYGTGGNTAIVCYLSDGTLGHISITSLLASGNCVAN